MHREHPSAKDSYDGHDETTTPVPSIGSKILHNLNKCLKKTGQKEREMEGGGGGWEEGKELKSKTFRPWMRITNTSESGRSISWREVRSHSQPKWTCEACHCALVLIPAEEPRLLNPQGTQGPGGLWGPGTSK